MNQTSPRTRQRTNHKYIILNLYLNFLSLSCLTLPENDTDIIFIYALARSGQENDHSRLELVRSFVRAVDFYAMRLRETENFNQQIRKDLNPQSSLFRRQKVILYQTF